MFATNRRRPTAATSGADGNATKYQVGNRRPSMLQTLASKITDKEWKDRLQRAAREGTEIDVARVWRMRTAADGVKSPKAREEMIEAALLDAIFGAIECDRDTLITPLIKCKSTIVARRHGRLEQTALHAAVKRGYTPVIKELLLHSQIIKAIDSGDRQGRTALHEAAKLGRLDIIRDLLANRADINAPDDEYTTPLHTAVLWGHESILEFLIKNGAEVNTRNQYGMSRLSPAVGLRAN